MNMLYRTIDVHALTTINGVVLFTKDSIGEVAAMVYKTLPLHGCFYTSHMDGKLRVGCIELLHTHMRIGIWKEGIYDNEGLLHKIRYDEENKDEIIAGITDMLQKYFQIIEGGVKNENN